MPMCKYSRCFVTSFWYLCVLQPGAISSSQSSPAVSSASNQERFYVHPRARSNEGAIATSSSVSKLLSHDYRGPQQPASSSSKVPPNGRKGTSSSVERIKSGQQIKFSRAHRDNKPHKRNKSKSNTDVKPVDGRVGEDSPIAGPQSSVSSPPLQ